MCGADGIFLGGPRRPAALVGLEGVYALPSERGEPLTSASVGAWRAAPGGGREWRACLYAAQGARSLTAIFGALRLVPGAELRVAAPGAPAGAGERFGAFDLGPAAAAPVAGAALELSYSEPAGSTAAAPGAPPPVELAAVLQGVAPLPAAAAAALRRRAGGAAVLEAEAKAEGVTGQAALSAVGDPAKLVAAQVSERQGGALECLLDAACFPERANATAATALLLLASADEGGRFCTGTFIAGPDPNERLILTANHCRANDGDDVVRNLWAVVLEHGASSCRAAPPALAALRAAEAAAAADVAAVAGGAGAPAAPAPAPGPAADADGGGAVAAAQVVTGLEIAFSSEVADVLILRLTNDLPAGVDDVYELGWNAAPRALAPPPLFSVHHSAGDAKKVSHSLRPAPLVPWRADAPTHFYVSWTAGATEAGSSGAALVDGAAGAALGVLTGGRLARRCLGASDTFGSLAAAWGVGLWEVLGAGDASAPRAAPGRRAWPPPGPGLIVHPSRLALREGGVARALAVRLARPPGGGARASVAVAVSVAPPAAPPASPPAAEGAAGDVAAAKDAAARRARARDPVRVLTPLLIFSNASWDASQLVLLDAGDDPLDEPLRFEITLELRTSDGAPPTTRVVPGLRTSRGVPTGAHPADAIALAGGPAGVRARKEGALAAAAPPPGRAAPGAPLAEPAVPRSFAFYNLTAAQATTLDAVVCSADAPLQLIVYANDTALWASGEAPCGPGCTPAEAVVPRCAGFIGLALPGTELAPPFAFEVRAPGGEAAGFELTVQQTRSPNVLFEAAPAAG